MRAVNDDFMKVQADMQAALSALCSAFALNCSAPLRCNYNNYHKHE